MLHLRHGDDRELALHLFMHRDSIRDIYGSRSLIYLLLSEPKYLRGVALLFVSKHSSRMRRKTLSTCPSVEKNYIYREKYIYF